MLGRELTVDGAGISEITYKRGDPDENRGYALIETLLRVHPTLDCSKWEMIGFTKAGANIPVDTIGIVMKGHPPEEMLSKYNPHPSSSFADYYQLKVGLDGSEPVLKVYDLTLGVHPLPMLPEGTAIHHNQGIGVHFGCPLRANHRDVYFTHNSASKMMSWAECVGVQFPYYGDEETPDLLLGMGVTWDVRTFRVLKLKRYFFPNDPLLNDPFSK